MRITHKLSALLDEDYYIVLSILQDVQPEPMLLRADHRKSLAKFGIVISCQSADWFQLIH